MEAAELSIVTGALGYTGKYITRRLVSLGKRVRTLTRRSDRESPFGDKIEVAVLDFEDPLGLTESMRGARTLYNTYWIRFPRGGDTFERAVANTGTLVSSAREAGLSRIVHISVTNPSPDSPFPYFRAKAQAEEVVTASCLSYAIIRPTLIFGPSDILINNIAYLLRRFPFFAVFGAGDYRLQPVYAEDVAELALELGAGTDNVVTDAAGPEILTFDELVCAVAGALGRKARIVHLWPGLALLLSRLAGWFVRDVLVTPDEVGGLMPNLLVSRDPPTCRTRFGHWLMRSADVVGSEYTSELDRHYRQALLGGAGSSQERDEPN